MTAEEHYQQGNAARARGDWKEALEAYNAAIALDADSPAATAKEMVMSILDFYHKDAYNP